MNFTLFRDRENFIDEYMYRNADGKILSGNTKIIFVELTKLSKHTSKPVSDMMPTEMWGLFLKYANDGKRSELVREIENTREGIAMAGELLNTVSNDRAMQLSYIMKMKHETDAISERLYATKIGREEGLAEGINKGLAISAKRMHTHGMDASDIELVADWGGDEGLFVYSLLEMKFLDESDGTFSLLGRLDWNCECDTVSEKRTVANNPVSAPMVSSKPKTSKTSKKRPEFKAAHAEIKSSLDGMIIEADSCDESDYYEHLIRSGCEITPVDIWGTGKSTEELLKENLGSHYNDYVKMRERIQKVGEK